MLQRNNNIVLLSFFLLLKIILSYVLVNNVYELHRDEFLHLDQANHLAGGFISVPPFTSVISVIIKFLGNSEFIIRLFPALYGAGTILFCWLIVELLEGNLFAKCLVAVTCICSVYLRLNTLYQPNSFDVLSWTAIFYYLLRYFKTAKPLDLYWLAIWAGLGILNKYNILFLFMGLLPALLITSKRRIFVDKHFWFAILLAFLIVLPNIIWQYNNHFPVIRHMKELRETQLAHVDRAGFFIEQLLFFITGIFVLLAAFTGQIAYKRHRWILLTYIFTIPLFVFFNAKGYYTLGLYPVLLASGSVYMADFLRRPILRILLLVLIIGPFICIVPLLMPLYSPKQIISHQDRFRKAGFLKWEDGKDHQLPQDYADMQGWKELARIVDSVYVLAPDKEHLIILCDNYGQAGAINYYSVYRDVHAVSFNADYIHWMDLDNAIKTKIRVREYHHLDAAAKDSLDYGSMQRMGAIQNPWAREYGTTVYLLTGPKIDVNAELKHYIWLKEHEE